MDKNIKNVEEYFPIYNLYIKLEKLDHALYFYKKERDDIENFTHDDAINDWLIEKVRMFNSSTSYLFNSIMNMLNMWNYYNNVLMDEAFLRMEIRNTCINISIYVEKIKSLCRYYFFFDENATKYTDKFMKTLKQLNKLDPKIIKFINVCYRINNDISYKWISNIRDSEIHNESIIDKHNYEIGEKIHNIIDKRI